MKRWNRAFGWLLVGSSWVSGSVVQGDAIQPWNVASARVDVLDQSTADAGSTAQASGSRTDPIAYQGVPTFSDGAWHPNDFTIDVHGSATARAAGQVDDLLSVTTHYDAGNPGSYGGSTPFIPSLSASARWDGDRVILSPQTGGTTPETVRLQLALTFQAPPDDIVSRWQFGSMVVDANGHEITVQPQPQPNGAYSLGPSAISGDFDSLKLLPNTPNNPYNHTYVGTFHVDLPLAPDGVSDPFHLGLQSQPRTGLAWNGGFLAEQDARMSLLGVNLLDGTSLRDAGYLVSFDSSQLGSDPLFIPEPASVVGWGLVALGAGWRFRRR